jgi:hypothetical protein
MKVPVAEILQAKFLTGWIQAHASPSTMPLKIMFCFPEVFMSDCFEKGS